jgi:hypothetical protein
MNKANVARIFLLQYWAHTMAQPANSFPPIGVSWLEPAKIPWPRSQSPTHFDIVATDPRRGGHVVVAELASRARTLLGEALAEAILTQDPSPTKFIGLERRLRTVRPETHLRLEDAVGVASTLRSIVGPPTIQAWFVGMNPELDYRAPAEAIATDPAAVRAAADHFVAHG